ncbi:GT4 family glycosyltransferase PelF [Caldimonas tepidiphila]|uniref:GT4 family glycosyltransferase PelF n=1 Tax=Caldimonas tepidiphila TaxID=2315841 RepID=UPI000E5B2E1E|nr:GT4 family glycosyltransferase PelF [Caldimonas tepidiphila]
MKEQVDVCIVVEGTYPYVTGGVSNWVHDLIRAQRHLSFHVVALVAEQAPGHLHFTLSDNVKGLTVIALQQACAATSRGRPAARLIRDLEAPLARLLGRGGQADFAEVLAALRRHPGLATRDGLMNSEPAFEMLLRIYEATVPASSFLNYFWSWRSLTGGLFSVLLAELPRARLYHAVSTGYAGLLMSRAVLETGRPGLLTEHGIYTNERRIEISMAEWLAEPGRGGLGIEKRRRNLRDVWLDAFVGYSRTCYECCSRIITLYSGNQPLQLRDGAPAERLLVVPNGIDYDFYAAIPRCPRPRRPTVALIGRVVPIKDVKTCIRAAARLRERVPDVRVLLLGPTDEDPAYFEECRAMVEHLGLGDCFEFAGRVQLRDYLGQLDALVLTSLSEAQPLVLLEGGAAGIPCVATNVGACRDIIEGRADEQPPLGPGGFVTPLADPLATAQALANLLTDPALHARCARALQQRVRLHYNKRVIDDIYRRLYEEHSAMPDAPRAHQEAR